MITKVSSAKNGQVVYHFDNGVELSMIWDWGSYSDNHLNSPKYLTNMQYEEWISTTVEIYSVGDNPNGIAEWLEKKYQGMPAGYVPVSDIPMILMRACRKVRQPKSNNTKEK